MRTSTGPRRAIRSLVLIPLMLVVNAALLRANPIAPTFWACDGNGGLHEIFVSIHQASGSTGWFSHHVCDLPTYGTAGASELEVNEATAVGVVQGRDGLPLFQRFNTYPSCGAVGPAVNDVRWYTGFEEIGGTLFAVDTPPTCGTSTLWRLDPVTGGVVAVGSTEYPAIEGLAWNPGALCLYGVSTCPPETGTLVCVDLVSGVATPVGDIGVVGLTSLEFTMGELVGGTDAAHGGQLYRIDPATAHATLVPGPLQPEITDFAGLAATGYGYIVPVRAPSWGQFKARYR